MSYSGKYLKTVFLTEEQGEDMGRAVVHLIRLGVVHEDIGGPFLGSGSS